MEIETLNTKVPKWEQVLEADAIRIKSAGLYFVIKHSKAGIKINCDVPVSISPNSANSITIEPSEV